MRIQNADQRDLARDVLRRVVGPDLHDGADASSFNASADSEVVVAEALLALTRANVEIAEFSLGQPSLDEVFFALTGHAAEEKEQEASA